tara:strand:+ start:161 stop:448 length:288 start_codon:yes stop_codon:yes gene_type:complete
MLYVVVSIPRAEMGTPVLKYPALSLVLSGQSFIQWVLCYRFLQVGKWFTQEPVVMVNPTLRVQHTTVVTGLTRIQHVYFVDVVDFVDVVELNAIE